MNLEYVTDGKRHLVCRPYSIENLHKMAADLGIHRCWFHSGKHPHYDIPKQRKIDCVVVTTREIYEIIHVATN